MLGKQVTHVGYLCRRHEVVHSYACHADDIQLYADEDDADDAQSIIDDMD